MTPSEAPSADLPEASRSILRLFSITLFLVFAMALLILREPWHDEIFTLRLMGTSPGAIIHALRADSGPPLHYLIAWGWGKIAGCGILQLRLLSLLSIALFILIVGKRSPGAALYGSGHLLLLFYAAEGRPYALLLLFLGATWLFLDGNHSFAALLTATAALYTHALAPLFLLPLFLLYRHRWKALAGAFVLFLPWIPIQLHQPRQAIAWMGSYPHPAGLGEQLLQPFAALAGFLVPGHAPLITTALAATLFILLILSILGFRRIRRPIAAAAGILFLLGLASAFTGLPLYFPGRTEILFLPLLFFAVSTCLRRLSPRLRIFTGATLLLLSLTAAIPFIASAGTASLYDRLAGALAHRIESNSVLITTDTARLEVTYFLGREGIRVTDRQVPLTQEAHPGWMDTDAALSPRRATRDLTSLLRDYRGKGKAIYLLLNEGLPLAREVDESPLWSLEADLPPYKLYRVIQP